MKLIDQLIPVPALPPLRKKHSKKTRHTKKSLPKASAASPPPNYYDSPSRNPVSDKMDVETTDFSGSEASITSPISQHSKTSSWLWPFQNSPEELRAIVDVIWELNFRMQYSLDTFVIALRLLKKAALTLKVEPQELRLYGIVMFWIASKTYESRQITVADLIAYSFRQLRKTDLIMAEYSLLAALKFELFVDMNHCVTQEEVQEELTDLRIGRLDSVSSFVGAVVH